MHISGRLIHQDVLPKSEGTCNRRAEPVQTCTEELYGNKCWENLRRFLQNIQKYISSDQIPVLQWNITALSWKSITAYK